MPCSVYRRHSTAQHSAHAPVGTQSGLYRYLPHHRPSNPSIPISAQSHFHRRAKPEPEERKKKSGRLFALAGHRLCAAATVAPALFQNFAPTRFPVLVLGSGSHGRIFAVAPLLCCSSSPCCLLQSSTRKKEDVALPVPAAMASSATSKTPLPHEAAGGEFLVSPSTGRPAHPPLELPASGMTRTCFFSCWR